MNRQKTSLSQDELRILWRIATGGVNSFRHELGHHFALISLRLRHCSDMSALPSDMQNLLLQDIQRFIEDFQSFYERLTDICRHTFAAIDDMSKHDPFILDISNTLSIIKELYPSHCIDIVHTHTELLKVIYPEATFYMILHELTQNAIKHSDHPVRIRVTVKMHGHRLCCVVEDSGPGITHSTSYIPVTDTITLPQSGGLIGVADLIYVSHGLLLFRRSRELGGTEVLIELPVLGALVGDRSRRFPFPIEPIIHTAVPSE
jgi:K+-sensing histidine kinase KdpD